MPKEQRFGDNNLALETEILREPEAPFVGQSKEFPFSCPNVDSCQMGMLQFETLGAQAGRWVWPIAPANPRNIIRINGSDIPGGITPAPPIRLWDDTDNWTEEPFWKSHSLVVPANLLRENNVLYVESVIIPTGAGSTLDDFIIDNVVVFFKTRRFPAEGGTLDPNLRPTASR